MSVRLFVDEFERELIRGRARWVADLTESFRDYRIGGHIFDLYMKGQTRGKGFLLSRLFAWTALPNYKLSLYGYSLKDASASTKATFDQLVGLARKEIVEKGLRWAWLVFFTTSDPPQSFLRSLERFEVKELGVGLLNVKTGKVYCSNNFVGKSLIKNIRIDRMVKEVVRVKG